MDNPNEYDESAYTTASNKLFEAVVGLWGAGAAETEIESQVQQAIENARETE